jgi:hypothetical protein
MNEEQVKKIIREEIAHFMSQSKYTFQRPIQILDGNDITLGSEHGTRIGTATGQKLGFYGVTPVIQQTAPSEPTGGSVIDVQCRSIMNAVIAELITIGIWKA